MRSESSRLAGDLRTRLADDHIFDVKGASLYLGEILSVSTMNKMRGRGNGPAYVRLGSRIGYPKRNLDRYKVEHTQRSTAQNKPPRGRATGSAA
jgi:hypothetical protein